MQNDINIGLAIATFSDFDMNNFDSSCAPTLNWDFITDEELGLNFNEDAYRQITPEEKDFLVRETKRIHAEFRALREERRDSNRP